MFNEASKEATKEFYKVYKRNINTLVEMFPTTFNKSFPLPLTLGSHKQIQKATGWKPWKVHAVMCMWTARMEYVMMACSKKHRYTIDGIQSGYISEEHMNNFVIRLNLFRDRSRIAQFVKDFSKEYGNPALMSVPVNSRPNLSRWM